MRTSAFRADLAKPEDLERILEINRIIYGEEDILDTPADYKWRCDQNPAGKAVIPVIRDETGKVAGFIWIVPIRIRINGKNYPAATATNLAIHPQYRDTFAYTKLMRRFNQIFSDTQIPLHFSFVSDKTRHQLKSRQPHTVTTVPLMIKLLDPKTLARSYFPSKIISTAAAAPVRLFSALAFRAGKASIEDNLQIKQTGQFSQEFDKFWNHTGNKYPVMAVRDRSFLTWRFSQFPHRSYRILTAYYQNQMIGYLVCRCRTIRGVKTGLIMDILVTPEPMGRQAGIMLLNEAENIFRDQKLSIAVGMVPRHTVEFSVYRDAGFRRLTHLFSPRKYHYAFFIHDSGNKDFSTLTTRDFFLTFADDESH